LHSRNRSQRRHCALYPLPGSLISLWPTPDDFFAVQQGVVIEARSDARSMFSSFPASHRPGALSMACWEWMCLPAA
jgi:hypothetical protein